MTRERSRPSGTIEAARDWYSATYSAERSAMPVDVHIKYKEWRIFSGDTDLFTVDEVTYDQAYIFVGAEYSYWYFFQNLPGTHTLEGKGILTCPLCGCCVSRFYPIIVDNVKSIIKARANKTLVDKFPSGI